MPVDRTRRFALPGIDELNRDQIRALSSPAAGQYLMVGGPGTGKSVVALLRARSLASSNSVYRTLVYNHLLDHSNRCLFGKEHVYSAMTWEKWFRNIVRHYFKCVPTLNPEYPGGYQPIDWEKVAELTESLPSEREHGDKFLIIDEGQDMPPAFYTSLINMGFVNFYVAADQNQRIDPERNSSRQDIENCLGLDTEDTQEFTINYRNTLPIAILAQHFYPNDPASPPVELPEATLSAMTPELWTYGKAGGITLERMAENILRLSDRNPRKLIGIIAPNNRVKDKFRDVLHSVNPGLDHGTPIIQTYESGRRVVTRFDKGGLMIINAQSSKGLEFDSVILADIDEHQPKSDERLMKSRFYVMVTRAREQVMMLRTGSECPLISRLLPEDPKVLRRN